MMISLLSTDYALGNFKVFLIETRKTEENLCQPTKELTVHLSNVVTCFLSVISFPIHRVIVVVVSVEQDSRSMPNDERCREYENSGALLLSLHIACFYEPFL